MCVSLQMSSKGDSLLPEDREKKRLSGVLHEKIGDWDLGGGAPDISTIWQ